MISLEALEETEVAVFLKTAEGQYKYINDAGAKMIGSRPELVIGQSDYEAFDAQSASFMIERDRRLMTSDKMKHIESVVRAANRWMRFHSAKMGVTIAGRRTLIGLSVRVDRPDHKESLNLLKRACAEIEADPRLFIDGLLLPGAVQLS